VTQRAASSSIAYTTIWWRSIAAPLATH
jgi:hypothetical protein